MDTKEACRGEPWMTKGEKKAVAKFLKRMQKLFRQRNVAETPLLAMRLNDVIVSFLLTRRAEQELATDPLEPGQLHKILDTTGKIRERLRRSMKDLEDACANAGTPIEPGLADRMKPLILRAQGLEDFPHATPSNPPTDTPD
jgi:hypothetical protein